MSNNIYVEKVEKHKRIFSYNQKLPENWDNIFPKKQPLIIDLGCGAGRFLLEKAQREPLNNYIGIETRYKRLIKAMKKYTRESLPNVFLVQRRIKLLSEIFLADSLQAVFVNFPDPWAKYKQLKHRLLCFEFFKDAYALLRCGGSISFKTDHKEYFLFVKNLLKNNEFLAARYSQLLQNPKKDDIITEFEDLFLKKNKAIYSIKIVKK
jgi:tRNA (guanine-N7-)-methyltransferase